MNDVLVLRPDTMIGSESWKSYSISTYSSTDQYKSIDVFPDTDAFNMMLVSENTLAKHWDSPEEDKAWAHL